MVKCEGEEADWEGCRASGRHNYHDYLDDHHNDYHHNCHNYHDYHAGYHHNYLNDHHNDDYNYNYDGDESSLRMTLAGPTLPGSE